MDDATVNKVQKQAEADVIEVRRSWRSIVSYFLLLAISLLLVLLFSAVVKRSGIAGNFPWLKNFPLWLLLIIPLGIFLEIVRKFHDDLYILDKSKITHLHGRLSLEFHIPVIKYLDIRAITIYQSLLGRILNYGTISLGTASHQGSEIEISGVHSPLEIADEIEERTIKSEQTQAASSVAHQD